MLRFAENLLNKRPFWVFGAGVLALFLGPLAAGLTYFNLDVSFISIPQLCEYRTIRQNGWPYWISPHIGGGEPLFANFTSQILYPLQWLAMAFSPETGASIVIAIHLALAFGGACWLARTFGLARRPAVTAGLLYVFSGTLFDLILHSIYLVGGAWLPWAWAAARTILHRPPSRAGTLLLPLAWAALLFGGEVQSWVLAHAILGLESVFFLAHAGLARTPVARVAFAWLIAALSDLLTSVQWIPTLAEMRLALHFTGMPREVTNAWAYRPASWLATAWPNVLRDPIQHVSNLWTMSTGGREPFAWNRSPYLGLIWMALVTVTFARRRHRAAAVVLTLSLFMALGAQTPVAGWFQAAMPVLRNFRYPSKYLVPFTLAAAVLAASALASAARNLRARRRLAVALATLAGTSLIATLLIWFARNEIDRWAYRLSLEWPVRLKVASDASSLSASLITSALAAAGPALIALVLLKWIRNSRVRTVSAIIVILVDLGAAAIPFFPAGPPMIDRLAPTPIHEIARGHEDEFTLCHNRSATGLDLNLEHDAGDWPRMALFRLSDRPNLSACDGLRQGVPYSALQTYSRKLMVDALDSFQAFAAIGLGCTHIVTRAPVSSLLFRQTPLPRHPGRPLDPNEYFLVYEVLTPLPRVFVARRPEAFADETSVAFALPGRQDTISLVRVVDDPIRPFAAGTSLPTGETAGPLSARWDNPSRVTVEAGGTGGAIVGVKTAFATGWVATQAGATLRTVRIGGNHLGAWIPDVSRGPVVFSYLPPFFLWALGASLCGAAGLTFAGLVLRRKVASLC